MPILAVKSLSISFKNNNLSPQKAVKDLSFAINKGETLGIVGESGSGKTLSALSILGLLPENAEINSQGIFFKAQEARVALQIDAQNIQSIRGKEISFIFQEHNALNPILTCGYQVMEVLIQHKNLSKKAAKEKVLSLFEQVKLPHPERIFEAYPHQLSGGQQQRVMIAMAISCDPQLLIADEPTTALDVIVQKGILLLLNELKKSLHLALIFISHDLGVMAEIADNILVLRNGELVEQGSTAQIFKHPQHPYTKGLIACRPTLNATFTRLPTIEDFTEKVHIQTLSTIEKKPIIDLQPILNIEHLKVYYPTKYNFWGKAKEYVKALDDISFEVFRNQTLGIVGESGSGKSTLAHAIMGLIPTNDGRIRYQGKDITQMSKESLRILRKDIQLIFQNPYTALNPQQTIGEAIMTPILYHRIEENKKKTKEKAIQLLEMVKLDSAYFDRFPHSLSGGQRQRVVIARALAVEPKILICDECVSALDVSIQAQILNLLLNLKEKLGLTYLFISHDLAVVKLMSENVMVLKSGHIEEIASSENIYQHPQSPYTQQLIAAIPKWQI